MQLCRLTVERFGCIERVEVDLCAGLNVLYGPNDLGKSSLAAAIRCALLLPHGSTAHEDFVSWKGVEPPKLSLVFRTEPRKFFRVTKVFHTSKGSSLLESGHDETSFVEECRARRVDEEIRKLLAWGIGAPGGRGGQKGVPQSFLATALIAEQGEVDEVLRCGLAGDLDDSGRQRVSQALQALAQDPAFKKVLGQTQAKVDEAFTATGKLKQGKNDPLTRARERINEADREVQASRGLVDETQAVEKQVRELASQRLTKEAERDEHIRTLAKLEGLVAAGTARTGAEQGLSKARAELGRIDGVLAAASELDADIATRKAGLSTLESAVTTAASEVAAAEGTASTLRERLRDLKSDASAQRIAGRRNELSMKKLELEAAERDARAVVVRADAAGGVEKKVADLATDVKQRGESLSLLGKDLAAAETVEQRAAAEQTEVRGLELLSAFLEAEGGLAKADKAATTATRLRAEAEKKSAEAKAMQVEVEGRKLPEQARLAALRKLDQELRVAEGQLAVGLSLEIKPRGSVEIELARDGGPTEKRTVAAPATFEAKHAVRLSFPSIADVVVAGGSPEARGHAARLRARWASEAVPLIEAAGATNLEALEGQCVLAAARADMARALIREAESLTARCEELGDVGAALEAARQARSEREGALAGFDRTRLVERATSIGARLPQELARLRRTADADLETARKGRDQKKLEIAKLDAQLEARKGELERARAELAAASTGFDGGWRRARATAELRRTNAEGERAGIEREFADLEKAAAAQVAEVAGRLEAAEKALSTKRKAQEEAKKARDDAVQILAKLAGQLEERRRAAALVDRAAALKAVSDAEAALAAVPRPERLVTAGEVTKARASLDAASGALDGLVKSLHQTEGALGQVGGSVAAERLEQAEAALGQSREQQARLEADYQAWHLLLETLREAEGEQASHLGKALVEPVAARFRALTGERYDGLSLGTDLATEGIVAAGQIRSPERLSVGTREQLATIFRLALAEQLGSVVLLDDQLVQSDLDRMAWFATVLRELANRFQIVVLTCRPDDYLAPSDLPLPGGPPFLDSAAGLVRAVDLGRTLIRA